MTMKDPTPDDKFRFVNSADTSKQVEREEKKALGQSEAKYDAELVRRFVAGDEMAFVEIVTRYRKKIYSVALSVLRNPHDAEEIAQDTFIRAHRGLARFRGDSSLVTWLHHIAVNLARNRYWYFHRRARHATLSLDCKLSDGWSATLGDLFSTDTAGPTREAASGEFVELVTASMERLDAGHREILTMRNVLNQSYDEIANALGIEVGTVKSRIARARKCLRMILSETCPEFGPDADPAEWLEFAAEQRQRELPKSA